MLSGSIFVEGVRPSVSQFRVNLCRVRTQWLDVSRRTRRYYWSCLSQLFSNHKVREWNSNIFGALRETGKPRTALGGRNSSYTTGFIPPFALLSSKSIKVPENLYIIHRSHVVVEIHWKVLVNPHSWCTASSFYLGNKKRLVSPREFRSTVAALIKDTRCRNRVEWMIAWQASNEKTLPFVLFHCPDIKEELSWKFRKTSRAAMKEVHCSMADDLSERGHRNSNF